MPNENQNPETAYIVLYRYRESKKGQHEPDSISRWYCHNAVLHNETAANELVGYLHIQKNIATAEKRLIQLP